MPTQNHHVIKFWNNFLDHMHAQKWKLKREKHGIQIKEFLRTKLKESVTWRCKKKLEGPRRKSYASIMLWIENYERMSGKAIVKDCYVLVSLLINQLVFVLELLSLLTLRWTNEKVCGMGRKEKESQLSIMIIKKPNWSSKI